MDINDVNSEGTTVMHVPPHKEIAHYHGDSTRFLFVFAGIVLLVAKSTGADLPLSTVGTVVAALLLVVTAGITNPEQGWIHWLNAGVAVCGTLLFGITAIDRYRTGVNFLDSSFIYIETLALISLIALYFTTRTIRGYQQRPNLS